MIKYLITVLTMGSLILTPSIRAQHQPRSREAQNLQTAFVDLQKAPSDPGFQERYLRSFPRNYADFLRLFGPSHELYDGFEYINVLPTLASDDEKGVGQILLRLSKQAKYDADAPSYLQQATATYASQHTRMFAALLKQLPTNEQAHVITFLADVEDHSAYPQYQNTIDHLKGLRESALVEEFQIAREQRRHHAH